MSGTTAVTSSPLHQLVPEARLESWPLASEQVVEGNPRASGLLLWKAADSKLAAGIWECTPGVFDWVHANETLCVVSGHARITIEGGEPFEIGPGSMAFFSEGTKTRWHVHGTIRKAFHLHSDAGLNL